MPVDHGGTNRLLDILERVADGGIKIAETGRIPLPLAEDVDHSESPPATPADLRDRKNESEP